MRTALTIWFGAVAIGVIAAGLIGLAGSVLDTYRAFTQPAACQVGR